MPRVTDGTLADLTPDPENANKGNERGAYMLEASLQRYGAGRSVVVDRNGVILAGNKTVEQAGALGLDRVVFVETDGTALVAVRRTDLDLTDPESRARALGLAIADNRAGEIGLSWSGEFLANLANEGEVDLAAFFRAEELDAIMSGAVDGMGGGDGEAPSAASPSLTCPKCGHTWTKTAAHG